MTSRRWTLVCFILAFLALLCLAVLPWVVRYSAMQGEREAEAARARQFNVPPDSLPVGRWGEAVQP